ncbi:MAG: hypothetical protein ACREX3_03280 [Gammaproteobacteria bacterium]
MSDRRQAVWYYSRSPFDLLDLRSADKPIAMVSLSFHTACVTAVGGQVVTLRYQEGGCSTSRILSELARVREAEPL